MWVRDLAIELLKMMVHATHWKMVAILADVLSPSATILYLSTIHLDAASSYLLDWIGRLLLSSLSPGELEARTY